MLKLVILENQRFILFYCLFFFALHPAVLGGNFQLSTWGSLIGMQSMPTWLHRFLQSVV